MERVVVYRRQMELDGDLLVLRCDVDKLVCDALLEQPEVFWTPSAYALAATSLEY